MFAFSGLDSSIYGCSKLRYIENNDGEQIRNVFVANQCRAPYNAYGPPKAKTISKKHRKLRKQHLSAMPSYIVGAFSIANIKNECS